MLQLTHLVSWIIEVYVVFAGRAGKIGFPLHLPLQKPASLTPFRTFWDFVLYKGSWTELIVSILIVIMRADPQRWWKPRLMAGLPA